MKKGFDMFRTLKWISAIVIAFGIVCSAVNITKFSDSNLGLMVGIGFLFGGVVIWACGVFTGLVMKSEEQQSSQAKERS